jgi:hypothetical protein
VRELLARFERGELRGGELPGAHESEAAGATSGAGEG